MTNLNNPPPAATDKLAQIIEQHISAASALLEILKQEKQALISGRPEQLEQVSATKLQSVNAFRVIGEKLTQFLGNESIESVLSRMDGANSPRHRWQELMKLATECQRSNLVNGAIIDERQNYVRHAIKCMFGQEARPAVYGRSGDTHFRPERHIIASA